MWLVILLGYSLHAAASGPGPILVTNDDAAQFGNTLTVFNIGATGALTFKTRISTGNLGIAGGYFGKKRVAVLDNATQQCIFASDAFNGDIAGVVVSGLSLSGTFFGSSLDFGAANGIGLAVNSNYLYASYSDSGNIGTFAVGPGCTLSFLNDTPVTGLLSGIANAMALRGNMLVVTYTDGTVESFNVSSGTPVSNGDKQRTTGTKDTTVYANDIDITQDGHYAIFGDTSTFMTIEVSDISSGKLAPTTVYRFRGAINSSNIMLSPDETVLYISNTQSGTVTAAKFDDATGAVTFGCTSSALKNFGSLWSYLGSTALQQTSGNGAGVYIPEYGNTNGVGSFIGRVNLTISGGTCTLAEDAASPYRDGNSLGLLSITTFPPRSF
jgi:hypothetical protein